MKAEFDSAAVGELQRLNLAGEADRVVEFLAGFEPRGAEQRFEYECGLGWALQTRGDYRSAVDHMLRALRATVRRQDLRVRARHQLAWTFMRSGDFARAERQLRRALDEVHATGVGTWLEPGLLNTLAGIHRRRGLLGLSIQTYEQALALPRIGPQGRYYGIGVSNLALALMRRGDLGRAQDLLDDLLPSLAESVPPGYTAYVHLSRARLALLGSDPDGCEAALEEARRAASPSDYQIGVRLSVQGAELELSRGHAARARTLLEGLLPELLHKAALNDLAPEAARLLAMALFELHRHEEALEKARLAAGLGRHADVLEWAAGLRVAGQCLAALGRRDEALAALEEARPVLRGTEFVPEQTCLDQTMKALGLGTGAPAARTPGGAGARGSGERGGVLARLRLRDGRTFVTHDVALIARVRGAASDRLPALIVGETGTGKELVAHLIHELSDRADSAFVVVDCATLPEGLAEAELFGAARGAFSGAVADRAGLIAAADGGTLFLDELPELSLALQAKLLRLLQEGTYRRVGENQLRSIDARIVAATNRDPEGLMASGTLKPDLFYRLDGHRLVLEPLRTYRHVIGTLAHELARGAGLAGITDAALARLQDQPWPGNVRQLEMLLRVAASLLGRGAWLDESDLAGLQVSSPGQAEQAGPGLRGQRLAAERRALQQTLETHGGNVTAAARSLSMSRQGFYKALRRTGLV